MDLTFKITIPDDKKDDVLDTVASQLSQDPQDTRASEERVRDDLVKYVARLYRRGKMEAAKLQAEMDASVAARSVLLTR